MNDWTELCGVVLPALENEPVEKRIRVMRTLADFAGDPELTSAMRQRAAELEAAHYRCRELHLMPEAKP